MSDSRQDMATTRAFWNSNPCGVHGEFQYLKDQRYAMEPWLPGKLQAVASSHRSILEIGCGQGVDAVMLCSAMDKDGRYLGIDYSDRSVATARKNAEVNAALLSVTPTYQVGDAENLEFADASFEAVFSMGVIHHTANPEKAIGEVHRVLEAGGKAYILLYRRPSLKVGVAKALRAIQHGLDVVFRTDRCLYRIIRSFGSHSRLFGTMFLECFGVPYMFWYTERELKDLFAAFSRIDLKSYGANFGRLSAGGQSETSSGYVWWIEATK